MFRGELSFLWVYSSRFCGVLCAVPLFGVRPGVSSAANADTVYLEISADESLHIRAFECRFTEERSLKRDELAFVVVTPYTIRKSRTGAILARLLGRVSAELIATQMFAFTEDMAERYAATIRPSGTAG
jgi:hypothetical protein